MPNPVSGTFDQLHVFKVVFFTSDVLTDPGRGSSEYILSNEVTKGGEGGEGLWPVLCFDLAESSSGSRTYMARSILR